MSISECVKLKSSFNWLKRLQGHQRHGGSGAAAPVAQMVQGQHKAGNAPSAETFDQLSFCQCPSFLSKEGFPGSFKNKVECNG